MAPSESATIWDVIVIGGGTPGEMSAQQAIQGSDRTAVIVEHEMLGGGYSYLACRPSRSHRSPLPIRRSPPSG